MENVALYNEFDPKAAAWLRQLAEAKHITGGVVDERSIAKVSADDVRRFERVHFFAGIGGWDVALDLAGWPTGRSVWTGSCPCQPFSQAGKRKGEADERDLWPQFFRLITECRPATVFGEQVASADVIGTASGKDRADGRRTWLDRIQADLEEAGYTFGACVLGAHSVGSPHIRQRLYWVANRKGAELTRERPIANWPQDRLADGGAVGKLANTESEREGTIAGSTREGLLQPDGSGTVGGLVDTSNHEHRGAFAGSGREEEVSETCDRKGERIAGLSARAGGEEFSELGDSDCAGRESGQLSTATAR